jgi:hypothetical protein
MNLSVKIGSERKSILKLLRFLSDKNTCHIHTHTMSENNKLHSISLLSYNSLPQYFVCVLGSKHNFTIFVFTIEQTKFEFQKGNFCEHEKNSLIFLLLFCNVFQEEQEEVEEKFRQREKKVIFSAPN